MKPIVSGKNANGFDAHANGMPSVKIGKGNLLNNALGIGAEILAALGLTLIGFVISLLCGW